MSIRLPYLIFLADAQNSSIAKTGFGVRDWAADTVIGQYRLDGCKADLQVPDLTPAQAFDRGARSLLIGVAVPGGAIPAHWEAALVEAIDAGLDIVSGMHARLSGIPSVREAAERRGRRLHDVRHADRPFPIATGRRRSGRRLLTVGTDCAIGKKYTALAITRELKARGIPADFRATGQTGIMISGGGVAVDAVVADFLAGAAEELSPDNRTDHWDVIEGQGSLYHPAYAAVTLGLLHGSQPEALVLCHDPSRTAVAQFEAFPLPQLSDAIRLYISLARIVQPLARFVGVSLNTEGLDDATARLALEQAETETGLPAIDPMRFGVDALVDDLLGAPKAEAA